MKIVSTAQMRELDRATIEDRGVPGYVLMDRAGRGVARIVRDIAMQSGRGGCVIWLVAGKGNNGGDATVAARILASWGFVTRLLVAGDPAEIRGDAGVHFKRMADAGVLVQEMPDDSSWDSFDFRCCDSGGMVVDGVLGTGIHGEARGVAAAAIRWINRMGRTRPVVAIDIPSGLDSDRGVAEGDAVKADVTITIGLPKTGLLAEAAVEYRGTVDVVDIGIPDDLTSELQGEGYMVAAEDVRELVGRRSRAAHKGTFGHVLVVGGASGYSGAVSMAVQAALRVGAGLVSAVVPRGIARIVAGHMPEAMIHGVNETELGSMAETWLDAWARRILEFDCILLGPGLTMHDESRRLVKRLLSIAQCPVVLDADGLNVRGGQSRSLIRRRAATTIITPHPGEMGRLLGVATRDVQADREGCAMKAVQETHAVVVLKGVGTIVAAPDEAPQVNATGNPGMATGGMGDVLGGVIAGLVAQGLAPFDAARAGVYVHGRAGDRAAWRLSQAGLLACDLGVDLPQVLREISGR